MGYAGGDRARLKSDATNKGDRWRGMTVTIDDGDLQDVPRGVGNGLGVFEERFCLA